MNSFFRWIFPFLYGIVTFSCIRLITDIPRNESFWADNHHSPHIYGQIICIVIIYLIDLICHYYFRRKKRLERNSLSVIREYIIVSIILVIGLNIIIYITSQLKFVYLNNIGDYILVNFTAIPLTLIYYTIIRSDYTYKSQNEQTLQLEKLKSDHLDSELKLLKAQYHPHFLFNALNTVYFQVDEENNAAKKTIELLSDLLRYQLYDIDRMVSVGQEIDYMKTYIRFQQLRMNERLVLNEHFDLASEDKQIHPLLFQPLLENAFKYVGGEYWIDINLISENNKIAFTVQNAIGAIKQANKRNSGIGIENLKRRLELLYSKKHSLKTVQKDDTFFAELIIEL